MPLKKNNSRKRLGISYHFEREAKIMAAMFWAPFVLAVIAGLFGPWIVEQLTIDKCLDRGGAHNYEKRMCAGSEREKLLREIEHK